MNRMSIIDYFLSIAAAVSQRATCGRRSVGCVLVDKHHNIISTGYNSVPSGHPHCPTQESCPGASDESGDTSRCIARHAEDIALSKCKDIYAVHTCYVTVSPCANCVRRLIDTGCKRIVFEDLYTDKVAESIWTSEDRVWIHNNKDER